MLWRTVAGEKLVVAASGWGIEVGVGTAIGSSWFPVGTITRAGHFYLEIVTPLLVARSPSQFQRPQRSLIICKVVKARAGRVVEATGHGVAQTELHQLQHSKFW